MPTRRETAYHEAGHVVVATALQKRVELVSIGVTGKVGGFCLFMEQSDPAFAPAEIAAAATEMAATMERPATRPTYSADERERRVLIALAGPEAQRRCTGGRWNPLGDEYDMQRARDLLGADSRSVWDVCAEIADARERTRMLLDKHWPAVEAVALALLTTGTLTGSQVRTLIQYTPAAGAA